MTAIEAIIFCLGKISDTPENGAYKSHAVLDVKGGRHWVEFRGNRDWPAFAADATAFAFSRDLEPYRMGE